MKGTTILILGGGIGGIVAAHRLRERLGNEHRIVVVDRSSQHIYAPGLLWLMVGKRRAPQMVGNLQNLRHRGIEFVQADIRAIDAKAREVRTSDGTLTGDYMIVALGADLAPRAVPGLAEGAYSYYDLAGAERLRDALAKFNGGRLVLTVAGMPYKCPAAPWEGSLLIDEYLRERSLRDRVEITAYTPEPLPMPVAGPAVGQALKGMVETRGIAFNGQAKLKSADPARRELTFEDGRKVEYDLWIAIPPHACPPAVKNSGLVGESGWVSVNPRTLQTSFERVFALGDVTMIKLANGKPLPKAGMFAHRQADMVVRTITADITRVGKPAEFDGEGFCVVETGLGRGAMGSGNFYAEPDPAVTIQKPGRYGHIAKSIHEKYWMWRWFGSNLPRLAPLIDKVVFGDVYQPA